MRAVRRSLVAVFAVVGLVVAAGCGGETSDRLPPPRTAEPVATPSPTPVVDPVEAEIIATLERYVEVISVVMTEMELEHPGFSEVAMDHEADHFRSLIGRLLRDGLIHTGVLRIADWRIEDLVLDPQAGHPYAFVLLCMDGSALELVDIDTGEPGIDEQLGQEYLQEHRAQSRLELRDGRWLVSTFGWGVDRPCRI